MRTITRIAVAVASGLVAGGLLYWNLRNTPTPETPKDTPVVPDTTADVPAVEKPADENAFTHMVNLTIMVRPDVVIADSSDEPVAGCAIKAYSVVDCLTATRDYLLSKYSISGNEEAITEVRILLESAINGINKAIDANDSNKMCFVNGESTIMISRVLTI